MERREVISVLKTSALEIEALMVLESVLFGVELLVLPFPDNVPLLEEFLFELLLVAIPFVTVAFD